MDSIYQEEILINETKHDDSKSEQNRLKQKKIKGKILAEKGKVLLHINNLTKIKSSTVRFTEAASYYFQSYQVFISCGQWQYAAESFKSCALTHKLLKQNIEAAYIYAQVAELYMKFDEMEAITCYRSAISLFCDEGFIPQAATLEKIIAGIYYKDKHWEDACMSYKKASNLYISIQKFIQCDICLEQSALCYIEMNELTEASQIYESIADGCISTNLRMFNCNDYLFKSIVCLFGQQVLFLDSNSNNNTTNVNNNTTNASNAAANGGKGDSTNRSTMATTDNKMSKNNDNFHSSTKSDKHSYLKAKIRQAPVLAAMNYNPYSFINNTTSPLPPSSSSTATATIDPIRLNEEYQIKYNKAYDLMLKYDDDYSIWKTSKEYLFLNNILNYRLIYDQENFINHLYWWTNIRPLDKWTIKMFEIMYKEIEYEINLQKIQIQHVEFRQKTKLMIKEQKKKLEQLGLQGSEIDSALLSQLDLSSLGSLALSNDDVYDDIDGIFTELGMNSHVNDTYSDDDDEEEDWNQQQQRK